MTLSSDRNLSEREILTLLATGGGARERTMVNRSSQAYLAYLSQEEEDLSDWSQLLKTLTRIDSLTLEPTFNFQTGVLEPTLIARKTLGDRLMLVGESVVSAAATGARAKVIYNLTPSVNVALIGDSSTIQQSTSLGADLTYTVLAEQTKFLETAITGNRAITGASILRALRISETSQVPVDAVDKLKARLLAHYRAEGFFDAQASLTCTTATSLCRKLEITVQEGTASAVAGLKIAGEYPEFLAGLKDLAQPRQGTLATERYMRRVEREAVRALRNEGYIAARVSGAYEALAAPDAKRLILSVSAGKPVTFIFRGNARFSAEEFLETINLFGRRQPFGNNTIRILVENMDRKYREAGFLYATIAYDKTTDPFTGRVTYLIDVSEESRIPVSGVETSGNSALTRERLKALTQEKFPDDFGEVWQPAYILEERLEQNSALLRELYNDEGFPDAQVAFKVVTHESPPSASVRYEINEGESLLAERLTLAGFPQDLRAPEMPQAPYSIPRVNRYTQDLLDALQAYGYFSPQITSEFSAGPVQVALHIVPGVRTRINDIQVEGNTLVAREFILKTLHVRPGDPWDSTLLDASRKDLLALGLFSQVRLAPAAGKCEQPQEELVVQVFERPLQALDVGFGLNSEYGLHLFGEGTDRSFFSDGRSLSLRVDTYYDSVQADISQGIASVRYTDPHSVGSSYLWNEELRYQKLNTSSYEFNLNRVSLLSHLSRVWDAGLGGSFGHTLAQETVNDVSPGAVISPLDEGLVRLSFLSAALNFDRRDNPLNPARGYNVHFDSKLSARGLGSDADFFGLSGKVSGLSPCGAALERWSIAGSASAGVQWTFGSTAQVPISERHYLGGQNTVRGFRENSLGPRGADNAVIGGDVYSEANIELRYRIMPAVSLHTFLDAGNVYLRSMAPDYLDLRYSTGLGARYLSPIGPIGLDIGFPLNREEYEPTLRVHFTIGTNF